MSLGVDIESNRSSVRTLDFTCRQQEKSIDLTSRKAVNIEDVSVFSRLSIAVSA